MRTPMKLDIRFTIHTCMDKGLRIFFGLIFVFVAFTTDAQRDKKRQDAPSAEMNKLQAEAYFVEGEKYFILEDYSKALMYFQKAAQLNPDDAGVHYKVAEVLSKDSSRQGLTTALASIEVALSIDKKNKYYYGLAAKLYAHLQNFSKAASTLETMMKEIPGTEEGLFDQSAYLLYAGRKEDALKSLNKAESVFGVNETSSLQKQRILLEEGKVNEAIEEAEKLIKTFPDEPQYVMAFAEMLYQNNQPAKAIQYLEKFDSENPGNGNARMLLSAFYKENGQVEKGNALLTSVFDDGNVEVSTKIMVMGSLNVEIEQARDKNSPDIKLEELAVSLFKKLLSSDGDNEVVSVTGGDLYLTIDQPKEAKYYYRKAIKQGASGFEPWQNLLLLESQDNQYDSLITHSEEGLELFPNQAALYYFNGFGHFRKRNYPAAAQSLEQAKKLSTGDNQLLGDINGLLGDIYNASRLYERSDKAYEDALVVDPNNAYVLNNYSYFLSLRGEKLDKAEVMSSKLVKLFPDNATYLDTYGWVLFMKDKYKEAKKVMEKAISLKQDNALFFEHYGDVLFQLGDHDEAVRQWQKAKTIDGNNEALNKKIANRRPN
jgi:tetratricopeptide (TPR) repeat protein